MLLTSRLLLLLQLGSVWAARRPPGGIFLMRTNVPPPPPPLRGANKVLVDWVQQKLDHFNPASIATWKQKYFASTDYYQKGGPAFLFISGEEPAASNWVTDGQMVDLAEENGALTFELEHRFYGDSHPTRDLSTENLRFLTSEQALADTAYFIECMNEKFELSGSKWIVFGGSYGGNLAAWMRLKYPHIVHGAVSSSAPVLAQTNFAGYMEVVGSVLKAVNPQCYDDVKNATEELSKLLQTEEGSQKVAEVFNFCKALDINNKFDLYYFQFSWALQFGSSVQYGGYPEAGPRQLCNEVTNKTRGATPLERYANIMRFSECWNISFNEHAKPFTDISWHSEMATTRAWLYQTCTEFGYYQTSDSPNQPFTGGFPLQYFIDECATFYGDKFNESLIDAGVERTNMLYGGQHSQVSNIVFVNGGADPWHVLGVLQDLSPSVKAIVLRGFSHCEDMAGASSNDPPQLTAAREEISALVKGWLYPEHTVPDVALNEA